MKKLKQLLAGDPGYYWIIGFICGAAVSLAVTITVLWILLANNYKLVI